MTVPEPPPVGLPGSAPEGASGAPTPRLGDTPSVLARIGAQGRFTPLGVHLREGTGEQVRAPAPAPAAPWNVPGGAPMERYRLAAELGRGGVGVVIKGHDLDLGRDVAMKLLLEEHAGTPEILQRFVEEAQIGGQLQHPGIVPIYELGLRTDKRPYFTMRLIKGRTLALLLAERKDLVVDLRRMLSIYESICQTVAYAHSRGVIHRDLKPANVMVGAFGEVLVIDWGMGKVLTQGAAVQAREQRKKVQPDVSAVTTPRSHESSSRSESGTVLGTLRYMPPEQAAGDVERVDERSDVFALGAILCEILTGEPPYRGEGMELLLAVAGGALGDAFQRIEGCAADPELKALARRCLSAEVEARPRDAGAVALAIGAYLASLEEKRRSAEAAAERARVVADEERKRRRLALALATTIVGLVLLAGGGWFWWDAARRARTQEVDGRIAEALDEAALRRGKAAEAKTQLALWDESLGLARNAEVLARSSDASSEARARTVRTLHELETERSAAATVVAKEELERRAVTRLEDIRMARREVFDTQRLDQDYAEAYREAGIDVEGPLEIETLAGRIQAFGPERRDLVIGQLYDWQVVRRSRKQPEARLAALLEAVDPDPWMAQVRATVTHAELRALAAEADVTRQRVIPLLVLSYRLGQGVEGRPDPESAFALAQRIVTEHPAEFYAHAYAALWGLACDPPHLDAALRAGSVLVALRPQSAYAHLIRGRALLARGDAQQAAEAFRASIAAGRDFPAAHNDLGVALGALGQDADGLAEIREALRLDPQDSTSLCNLALCFLKAGDTLQAAATLQQALALQPDDANALALLAGVLRRRGDPAGALRAAIEALRLRPDLRGDTRVALRLALQPKANPALAILEFRLALRTGPEIPEAHIGLGFALRFMGRFDESLAELRTGHELGSRRSGWSYPSPRWLADAERLAALAPRADPMLDATAQPANALESLDLAVIARARSRHATSARLYAAAFQLDPTLVHDGATNHRYDAACVAALAGAGVGREARALDDTSRARWRRQVVDWLATELDGWAARADGGDPHVLRALRDELSTWHVDPDLATIFEPKRLAQWPLEEQRACRAIVRDAERLIDNAKEAK